MCWIDCLVENPHDLPWWYNRLVEGVICLVAGWFLKAENVPETESKTTIALATEKCHGSFKGVVNQEGGKASYG
jgi:uncharacterized membrane protein